MDKSKLLESWGQFAERCPDNALEIRKIICSLYEARSDQTRFVSELNRLQGEISVQAQNLLGINPVDLQALAMWAQAMGMIFLVKKERSF